MVKKEFSKRVLIMNQHDVTTRGIYEQSQRNHIRYAEYHKYDYFNIFSKEIVKTGQKRSTAIDVQDIKLFLNRYDYVAVVGSNVLFTNKNIKIEDFPLGNITVTSEQFDGGVICGDFVVFKKRCELTNLSLAQNKTDDFEEALGLVCNSLTIVDELCKVSPDINKGFKNGVCWKEGDFSINFRSYDEKLDNEDIIKYMQRFRDKNHWVDNL